MSTSLPRLGWLVCLVVVPAATISFAGFGLRQSLADGPRSSAQGLDYFPEDLVQRMGGVLSRFLTSADEPRLYGVVQRPDFLCYRFDWMAGQSGRLLAVRFCRNTDQSAGVTSIQGNLRSSEVHKKELNIPAVDAKRFLQLVEDARFWTMSAVEPENPDPNRRVYKLGADIWIFEGVRNGNYHVVMRLAPGPGRFADLAYFLTKDLAKLDESWIPKAFPPPVPIK